MHFKKIKEWSPVLGLYIRWVYLTLFIFQGAKGSCQSSDYLASSLDWKGHSMPFRYLLPQNYSPDQSYPLVVFLHGAGERGIDNALQLTHGSPLFLTSEHREKYPAIVVFPQCPENGYWASIQSRTGPLKFVYLSKPSKNIHLKLVEQIIKHFQRHYRINADRIYVGGLSMGGMGTYELVYRNPRKFAAAFAICGGADPVIAKRIRRPHWRIDHGTADSVVPVQLSQQMVSALRQQKAQVESHFYREVDHHSWEKVFNDPNFLPWLFAQRRD